MPVDLDDRLQQRGSRAIHESRPARELDRGARSAVHDADRMDTILRLLVARDREPVIARELPGNVRKRDVWHDAAREVVGRPSQ